MGGEGRVKQGWLKSISAGWGGHRLAPLAFGDGWLCPTPLVINCGPIIEMEPVRLFKSIYLSKQQ